MTPEVLERLVQELGRKFYGHPLEARNSDLPAAFPVAERLRQAVDEWRWNAPDLGVGQESLTISIGVSPLGPVAAVADDLLRSADNALHRAQAAGRNRVNG